MNEPSDWDSLTDDELAWHADRVLNRLARWRMAFASWQLGTRPSDDPECQAVRDYQERRILQSIELNALIGLLIKKGFFSQREFTRQMIEEALVFEEKLEQRFPGFKATDAGMQIDPQVAQATTKNWPP